MSSSVLVRRIAPKQFTSLEGVFLPVSLFLFATIFPISGCHHSTEIIVEPPLASISNGILPLKAGYYWEYKTYALTDSGTTGRQISSFAFKIVRMSVGPILINQDTLFHWAYVDTQTGQASYIEWLFRNYEDGLNIMGGWTSADSVYARLLYLRYPVNKGETWKAPHLVFDDRVHKFIILDSIAYTCVDTNALFDTPLGSFSCVVYNHLETMDPDVTAKHDVYEYYVKGIGQVGVITYNYFESTQKRYPLSKDVLVSTTVLTRQSQ